MNGYLALARCRRTTIGDGEEIIIPSLFDATKKGLMDYLQQRKDKETAAKSSADSATALQSSTSADRAARDALAKAILSEETKAASAQADRLAADLATQAQDVAAAGLSPENQKRRSDAARAMLETATTEWQSVAAGNKPEVTKVKEAWVRASQQVYAKTQNAMMVQAARAPGGVTQYQAQVSQASSSWLTRPVLGTIPGWGVLAGALAAVGSIAIIATKVSR